MEIMKLNLIGDICVDIPQADASRASKKKYLEELAGQIVDDYVLNIDQNKELANRIIGDQGQTQAGESNECDDMLAYQKALMEYGLLLLNFKDAISEGDGDRNLRCWKFFLLHLRNDKRSTKYALEALYMMFQVNSLLSPKAAHELNMESLGKVKKWPRRKHSSGFAVRVLQQAFERCSEETWTKCFAEVHRQDLQVHHFN